MSELTKERVAKLRESVGKCAWEKHNLSLQDIDDLLVLIDAAQMAEPETSRLPDKGIIPPKPVIVYEGFGLPSKKQRAKDQAELDKHWAESFPERAEPEVRYDEEGHSNEDSGKPHPKPEPTSAERERLLKLWDNCYACASSHLYGATKYGPDYHAIRALIVSGGKKTVSRVAFDAACVKFSGHWAGTLDDVRRLGQSILRDVGIEVEPEVE